MLLYNYYVQSLCTSATTLVTDIFTKRLDVMRYLWVCYCSIHCDILFSLWYILFLNWSRHRMLNCNQFYNFKIFFKRNDFDWKNTYLLNASLISFWGFKFFINRQKKLTNSSNSTTPLPSTSTSLIISLTSLSVGFCPIVRSRAVNSWKMQIDYRYLPVWCLDIKSILNTTITKLKYNTYWFLSFWDLLR